MSVIISGFQATAAGTVFSNPLLLASIFESSLIVFAPAFRQTPYFDRALEQLNLRVARNIEMIEFGDRQAGHFARKKFEFVSRADFALFDYREIEAAVPAAEK